MKNYMLNQNYSSKVESIEIMNNMCEYIRYLTMCWWCTKTWYIITFVIVLSERIVDGSAHDKPLTSSWPNELKLQEIENDEDDKKTEEDDLDEDEDYDDDEYYEDDDEFDDDYDDEEEDDLDDDYEDDEEDKVLLIIISMYM